MSSTTVGDELGVRLHIKAELFQKTGSFKPRGVFNKLLSMDPADLSRGLVSLSAGNHAAALAYGATAVGAKATIVMSPDQCCLRPKAASHGACLVGLQGQPA